MSQGSRAIVFVVPHVDKVELYTGCMTLYSGERRPELNRDAQR